jgi:hypothetical protein
LSHHYNHHHHHHRNKIPRCRSQPSVLYDRKCGIKRRRDHDHRPTLNFNKMTEVNIFMLNIWKQLFVEWNLSKLNLYGTSFCVRHSLLFTLFLDKLNFYLNLSCFVHWKLLLDSE